MGMTANYPDQYAEALALQLTPLELEAVLDLARVVAHGSERHFAPLSTYLAGQFVAELVRTGVPREEALAEAIAIAERTLGGESSPNGSPPAS
ncbi:MAG: hypothetical protein AVDCRST_MAG10-2823 [uncultured Acidimicrobiales bacterium]|uniref:DUF6457 domain-containing protein n=1 Tax=uncultured Acidimicrobiales bacterium TaxID=310071 RepID=A0A6J4IW23_9ACTN|nr:MAG: hypothetical protein AVDCRST_MAG10-2823 [uncultured Acidimicrobiales bacterium]